MFDSGIFWVGKFGKYFLGAGLIEVGFLLGIQNNVKILGSNSHLSWRVLLRKSTTNLFSGNFYDLEIRHDIFLGLIFVQRLFLRFCSLGNFGF